MEITLGFVADSEISCDIDAFDSKLGGKPVSLSELQHVKSSEIALD
jgi:hypothetical protein